jgi:CRP-like cAMP-binding protein
MASILSYCVGLPERQFEPGTVLLSEGERSGHLFVLVDGAIEVFRGETSVAVVEEPGSVFGEMSILLGTPHTATVRATAPVTAYVVEDARTFLQSRPDVAFFIARLLAERLNAATTYLVDLKRQFEGHNNHLGMVGEVLESLMHHQRREFVPGSDRQPDPRM